MTRPSRHKKTTILRQLFLSAGITVLLFIIARVWIEGLDFQMLPGKLGWPMIRLVLLIGFGLVVGQIIEAAGWTDHLAVVARPLFRFGRLDPLCGAAFTTAFISGAAANAMLQDGYLEGKISKKSLFVTNIVNHLPAYFLHLPTTVFIVLPLTGRAGAIYFFITLVATLVRITGALVYNRLSFSGFARQDVPSGEKEKKIVSRRRGSLFGEIRRKVQNRILRIIVFIIPIYTGVFFLNAGGVFAWVRTALAKQVALGFIPVESMSLVVIGFAAEFTSGFAAAGAMLDSGILTVKQAAIALLVGNIVALPVRALRHQIPRYLGIFSPKLGFQLLGVGQGTRVLSIIIVGSIYYWLF